MVGPGLSLEGQSVPKSQQLGQNSPGAKLKGNPKSKQLDKTPGAKLQGLVYPTRIENWVFGTVRDLERIVLGLE